MLGSGQFRPGPPRNTKTTYGWFFSFGGLSVLDAASYNELLINI
jgi:hypothetical protein